MSVVERLAKTISAAALIGACGGQVNLGERQSSEPGPPEEDSNSSVDDPYFVPSTRMLPLLPGDTMGTLAVFGEFLYFGLTLNNGHEGLYRCKKADCERSRARLAHVTDPLYTLGVAGQRLVVSGGDDDSWIGSYALPDVNDKQVIIDHLPLANTILPNVHREYVYWPLALDYSLYRCALPGCAGGPTQIGESILATHVEADGELLFASDWSSIVRIAALGDGALEHLQPDATLSPAPAEPDDSDPDSRHATQIRTDSGKLYATVQPSSSDSPTSFVRWPVIGGSREDLFETPDLVSDFFVFGAELAWLARRDSHDELATLATCRVEACSSTLRHLGQVRTDLRGIAADDERLYWLQTARVGDAHLSEVAIRSVGLLPAP
jgi:hypothetical protein